MKYNYAQLERKMWKMCAVVTDQSQKTSKEFGDVKITQKRRNQKMNKYRNKKVIVDDYIFDSIQESKRYKELKLLLRAGEDRIYSRF